MPSRTLPNLGLKGFYDVGENGWGAELSQGLLKLSVLVQAGVLGRVAAVPGAPAAGDVYVLTAAPNKNAVAVYDDGAWVYYQPNEGWLVYDRDANVNIQFTGVEWEELVTSGGGGGGGIPDAPEDGTLYGRKDGTWEPIVGGGGGGSSRVLASARIDCSDPEAPVIDSGHNVASINRTGVGHYTVSFTDPIDPDHIGFSGSGKWVASAVDDVPLLGIDRNLGVTATEISLVCKTMTSTAADGQTFDNDDWLAFEVYDVRQAGGGGSGDWAFNPPTAADFPVTYGAPIVTDDPDVGLCLELDPPASNHHMIAHAVGATAWTITARIDGHMATASAGGYGLGFYNASSTKFFGFAIDGRNWLHLYRMAPGGYDGFETQNVGIVRVPPWLRMRYDPATGNIGCDVSVNGKLWRNNVFLRNVSGDLGGNPAYAGLWVDIGGLPQVMLTCDHYEYVP